MKRCEAMVGIGRRRFLSGAGLATVGAAVASVLPAEAKAAAGQTGIVFGHRGRGALPIVL